MTSTAAMLAVVVLAGCAATVPGNPTDLRQEVLDAERAFAATMAARDVDAFASYLDDEAVFFSGDGALRGKAAVIGGWQPFFTDPAPPFSWAPDDVEVLESGTLALSSGPVYGPDGEVIGRFNSIWRRHAPGLWRVVFDKGSPVCPPAP